MEGVGDGSLHFLCRHACIDLTGVGCGVTCVEAVSEVGEVLVRLFAGVLHWWEHGGANLGHALSGVTHISVKLDLFGGSGRVFGVFDAFGKHPMRA